MRRLNCLLFALLVLASSVAARQQPQPTPADCGCEAAPLPEVLAVVNGIKITKHDFSPETEERVAGLQAQVVAARRRELELQINGLLLEAEAKRLKLSTYQLLENEVVGKTPEPTAAEVQAFFDENKTRLQGDFATVRGDIVAHLRELRQREQARKLAERLRAAATVQLLVPEATPPASAADRTRLFANVNGQRITSADIEDTLAPLIFSVQDQVYAARRQDLELKINDILLANEAQKRQLTTRALLDAEVDAKVLPVTDVQAQAFFNENKARINGAFAQVKGQIVQYLKEAEAQRLRLAFARRLRQAATIQTFLSPPIAPVFKISSDNQPMKGSANAAVTLVVFTDFQSASCAQTRRVLEQLITEYGDRLRVVERAFPLSQHKQAVKAAEAAEGARAQGKYWEYTALLYANQSALEIGQLKEYASRVGLDRAQFDAALDGGAFAEEVRRDIHDGERIGVVGVPTIFVNGRLGSASSYEELKAAVEAALKGGAAR
jgi:protein-disulfide isomerase